MAEKGKVFTGARARLSANGRKVGFARNANGGETLTYERNKVLDNIQTEEHVPTDYDVRFSMSSVRLVGDTVKSRGIMPSLGANVDQHLRNILTNGTLTMTVEDNQTGSVIYTIEQAKVTTNNWSLDAVGIVGTDNDFVAIRMRDESEV